MVEISERFGPYTCVRRLGAGGMAETFLAVQRGVAGFEQRVCVKFILPALRDEPSFNALFLREAAIAASLRHSNIVGVIDVDQERGYIVLELVDGVDLRALLNAAPNHRLPPHLVTMIALELCKALAYAHSRTRHGEPSGVVHRDVSPSNVLVSYAGEVKLADFGIAKAICSDHEPQSRSLKGKLCYMSPEQTRSDVLDGRSDLFSLGIVCYELLTGLRPFDGQHDAETILNINQGKYTPLRVAVPEVPEGLAQVVERALCVDRAGRYADADAFIDALIPFAAGATAYRELGQYARHARPHETLATEDLPLEDLSSPSPLRASAQATRALSLAPSAANGGKVSVRAWAMLGASVVLLVGVLATWAMRADRAAPLSPQPAAVALTPSAAVPVEQAGAPAAPALVSVTSASTGAATAPARAPEQSSRITGQATLRVGTIPLGQVWIDGKPAGWSPVVMQLAAGRHVIAGGTETPQVRRELRLRPGERRQLVLNLDEQAAPSPSSGATARAEGR